MIDRIDTEPVAVQLLAQLAEGIAANTELDIPEIVFLPRYRALAAGGKTHRAATEIGTARGGFGQLA